VAENRGALPELARLVIEQTVKLYKSVGWNFPWIGYRGFEDNVCVSHAPSKARRKDNKVEIEYHTFPEHEGRGVATRMAEHLCSIAKQRCRMFA